MIFMKRLRVLFFSLWYPHRYDAMDGLFVRKHAQAVARYADVEVLFLYADEHIRQFETTEVVIDGVREVTVYFPKRGLLSYVNYFRAFRRGMKLMHKPDVTQTNVIGKDGLCSWWLKKTQGIPYVVVEHWTGFLPQNFSYRGFFRRRVAELVARNASMIMPVSHSLGNGMKSHGLDLAPYECINNVVDDFFFVKREKTPRTKKRFVNITCFDDRSKNVSGLLRTVRRIANQRDDFEFVLVGTGRDFKRIYELYQTLDFPEGMVRFTGELMPEGVYEWLTESDFMVLFSNYETFSVVAAEAICVGLPVVASSVGIVPNVVTEDCGIVINPGDETALEQAINFMLDNFSKYDMEQIRSLGHQFSFEAVGKHLLSVYERALNEKH